MNTLTHNDESFDFTTVDELLSSPWVQRYAHCSHMAYGGKVLWAYDGKAWNLIGRLKEPVRLPKEVRISFAQDQGA